jgi:hypothetical protein
MGHPVPASGLTVQPSGPIRPLANAVMSINGQNLMNPGGWWSSSQLRAKFAQLGPQILRFFGGSTANYWDWQLGQFINNPYAQQAEPKQPPVPVLLSDWAAMANAANAVPLYNLNVLTSSLSYQLQMLHTAHDTYGLPILYVELGNELYRDKPGAAQTFPSGAEYGTLATQWIAAIKADFPSVKVAACGHSVKDGNPNWGSPREPKWNQTMLTTLSGEDALTFHTYWGSGLSGGTIVGASDNQLGLDMASPYKRFGDLKNFDFPYLPSGVTAWVTESNLFDRHSQIHGFWAQALHHATYACNILPVSTVEIYGAHCLIDTACFGAVFNDDKGYLLKGFQGPPVDKPTQVLGRTATGFGYGEAMAAINQATDVQALAVSGAPILATTNYPAILGAVFNTPAGPSALLVNLTRTSANLNLPANLIGRPYQISSAPFDSWIYTEADVTVTTGTVASPITVPAFSITRIG